jgi:hypothetical protein
MNYLLIENGVVIRHQTVAFQMQEERVVCVGDIIAMPSALFSTVGTSVPIPADYMPKRYVYADGAFTQALDWIDPTPQKSTTKREITFGVFQDLCYNAVDGGALGRVAVPAGSIEEQFYGGAARFGAIVKAVETDTSDTGKAAWQRYQGGMVSGFEYERTIQFLVMIAGYMEDGELAAISAAWPEVV